MACRRFLAVLIFLCVAIQSKAAMIECDRLLLTPSEADAAFEREFERALGDLPKLKALYMRTKRGSLKSRVLNECLIQTRGCSPSALGHAVADLVAKTELPNSLGYGFLIGGMAAMAAGTSGIAVLVNPGNVDFLPVFVNSLLVQTTFLGVSLLAPFQEPLGNKIRRFFFAQTKGGTVSAGSELETQADLINATYTLREQQASDRIITFRNAIRLNFERAAMLMLRRETGSQSEKTYAIAAELGDAAMAGYRHFRDLSPRDPTIISAIHAVFLRDVADPGQLYAPALAYIKSRDPSFDGAAARSGQVTPRQYYEMALAAWLQLQE